MGWKNKTVRRRYVDYWLRHERTDLVTEETTVEYYINRSADEDPNIYVDDDNENEIDKAFWSQVTEEDYEKAEMLPLRTVEYLPTSETDEDQVKTLWVYYFSYREERTVIPVRERHLCVNCEHYRVPVSRASDEPEWCDFRNGMAYYCNGYADLLTCRNCRFSKSSSEGKCAYHKRRDGVTGKVKGGNCSEWNTSGECGGFSERFDDGESSSNDKSTDA